MSRDRGRAGRTDVEIVRASPHFDAAWYARRNPDVGLSGIDPAMHYLLVGGPLGRDPGPRFDAAAYVERVGKKRLGKGNPLVHFEKAGRGRPPARRRMPAQEAETGPLSRLPDPPGRPAEEAREALRAILERRLEGRPERLMPRFDADLAGRFLAAAADLPAPRLRVSVIVPAFDRAGSLGAAVESVLGQSHRDVELVVVDDGSTDGTPELLASYHDPRLVVVRQERGGVSAARNAGLSRATGDVIAYLDSDNVWTPDAARLMALSLEVTGARSGYAGLRVEAGDRSARGYRGEPFDWEECLRVNYVDLNVFFHDRALLEEVGGFDAGLRRMVDWDFVLRCTREHRPVQAPFLACVYDDDDGASSRITGFEPIAFAAVVQEKARHGLASAAEAVERVRLRFALRIAAPRGRREAWGDFHFAEALQAALAAQGHEARIDFLGEWSESYARDDVVLVLRGLTEHEPQPGAVNIIWTISHPDQVPYDEYEAHDAVLTASGSHAALLSRLLGRPVHALPQCTDTRRFRYAPHVHEPGRPALFVGNSRKADRPIVRWAVEAGEPLEIWGEHWEGRAPPAMVRGQNLPNAALSERYAGAHCVLNDHWPSMRDFGIVSNRVFDVVASGGRLISDGLPSIEASFGDVVETVEDRGDLVAALGAARPPAARAARRAASEHVAERHSFDARAAAIVDVARAHLAGRPARVTSGLAHPRPVDRRLRVGIVPTHHRGHLTSSAWIRLVAPLTTDRAHLRVEPVMLTDLRDEHLDECDACIVQRVAIPEVERAGQLIEALRRRGMALFVDTDDAFGLHEAHAHKDEALRLFMREADEVWFSTRVLAEQYPEVADRARIVANQLDPRFWRDYRRPQETAFGDGPLRLLYMGTATHDEDLALLRPGLEALAADRPGSFELTLIGVTRTPDPAPWLRRLKPPAAAYPRFVRWLAAQRAFDVGLTPLADTAFNAAKSDVKALDYSALGLLTLATDGPAYRERIGQGLAVGVGPAGWREAIEAVLDDRDAFEAIRAAALRDVWERRSTLVHPHPILSR